MDVAVDLFPTSEEKTAHTFQAILSLSARSGIVERKYLENALCVT